MFKIFHNIDIILDEVLKTRRLPLAIAKQSTMISINNLYDNLDRKLSEYEKINILKENGKDLGLDNRQLYRFEEIKDFESLVSDINDRYLNSLWIILSAIEDFIPRLAEPEFKYLEKKLVEDIVPVIAGQSPSSHCDPSTLNLISKLNKKQQLS